MYKLKTRPLWSVVDGKVLIVDMRKGTAKGIWKSPGHKRKRGSRREGGERGSPGAGVYSRRWSQKSWKDSQIVVIRYRESLKASTGFYWPIVTTVGHLSPLTLIGNSSFGRGNEHQNLIEWSFLEPDIIKRSYFAIPATYKFQFLIRADKCFKNKITGLNDSPCICTHAQ